jgi:hypothetical protein
MKNIYLYEVQACYGSHEVNGEVLHGLELDECVCNYEDEVIKDARKLIAEMGLEECKELEVQRSKIQPGIDIIAIRVYDDKFLDYGVYSTIDIEHILNEIGCVANKKVYKKCSSYKEILK